MNLDYIINMFIVNYVIMTHSLWLFTEMNSSRRKGQKVWPWMFFGGIILNVIIMAIVADSLRIYFG